VVISKEQIKEARIELLKKSKVQIEKETAIKWAARAIAAYSLFAETQDASFLFNAIEYHHEAVEHASDTPLLGDIIAVLNEAQAEAMELT
jgi:hypothetical protein